MEVLSFVDREHCDWFDDNNASIRKLFESKNCLLSTYIEL